MRPPLPEALNGSAPFARPVPRIASLIWGGSTLCCFAFNAFVLGIIVPKFVDVFESVDIELPALTQMLVDLSRMFLWCSPLWILAAIAVTPAIARRPRVAYCLVIVTGISAALATVALFLPLTTIGCVGIGRNR